ncbi:DUF5336 domain-containing protein [Streptomyces sp. ST2-7A]|uniref:DUF5336 domain-containing protein n=1 Tax=Streptomyces sp. ST2-7A TaxID=2907214 RepID=UPI001F278016|nr:DUF5336 domain-containing protein [Streptomyces sp. ST2-7A]MCE7081328.1 DUF5336 domain-containing protein [Streptomyces sp. ST2-7A]
MNNRSLTRGDAVVLAAAVLLFIASFLNYYSHRGYGISGWHADIFPVLPSIFLAGFIAAGLIVGSRFMAQPLRERLFLGLRLEQWGIALAVTSLWAAFWSLIGGPSNSFGPGKILAFLAALLLAGAAAATPMVPALQAPLTGGPKPAAPPAGQPQFGQPGHPGPNPQAGYGYPQQQPTGAAQQPVGAPGGQPQPGTPAGGVDHSFQPFWFAVPAQRPLFAEDGSSGPIAELTPGTWYLAVEQRGPALVAQTQDGRRGVLHDTSDIHRS